MATSSLSFSSALKQNHLRTTLSYFLKQNRCYSKLKHAKTTSSSAADFEKVADDVPTSGICRPLSEILKELNKKVPDSLVKTRVEKDGFHIRYIPWHTVNRVLNLHAPEWSGEVRNIAYSADAKSVSVVYRVTLYGTDAEIFRESTGTASTDDTNYGDPVQKAEAMAFRRACARFGLGLHLYHEEAS
ncbi:putative DNA repair protein Rad52/59/22 [Medicago truncatula]|uniref:Putative DNA repair protein Rad52/59/22 n=1 Tax=Medicago truncatula TaxID=3880 RepID=G7JRC9_MEDTR|nr:DNA repair RAD52-like protein 1, mitochondrial [Medicago truncatula]AES87848.1 SnRK1-interacting protein [Medicago truncatula]RHN59769.1 putative DNA repair protein Rad52/59/22 [Medicago truncatula]